MQRMIDQIRASKLPSNMMQFAARGALSVPPAENIEILVHLATHNKVFGDIARMTLAGWDEKASLAAASDPKTSREVLDYFISPDNVRPKLLPTLIENSSVTEESLTKFAISASPEAIRTMLASPRIKLCRNVLETLRSNPYLEKPEADRIAELLGNASLAVDTPQNAIETHASGSQVESPMEAPHPQDTDDVSEAEVLAYLTQHAAEIATEGEHPFQAIGGSLELLADEYAPTSQVQEATAEGTSETPVTQATSATHAATAPKPAKKPIAGHDDQKRENTLQKIKNLDVKGRIQLALKGNKEERSILIRDGTKVVALAVLDAPKISDGEVEKFASQKNVLEAVLRQIPLKRRFMKNYIVVRNLVANPRTPLDLALGLMKNLLIQDLKNLSSNKEVSDTIRKLALKMYKQKLEAANKK